MMACACYCHWQTSHIIHQHCVVIVITVTILSTWERRHNNRVTVSMRFAMGCVDRRRDRDGVVTSTITTTHLLTHDRRHRHRHHHCQPVAVYVCVSALSLLILTWLPILSSLISLCIIMVNASIHGACDNVAVCSHRHSRHDAECVLVVMLLHVCVCVCVVAICGW